MTKQNLIQLKEQLQSLEFEKVAVEIDRYKEATANFFIYHGQEKGNDQLMYILHFEKGLNSKIALTSYQLGLRHIPIPDVTIRGINSLELEKRMIKADELRDQFREGNKNISQSQIFELADNDVIKLMNTNGIGNEIAKLLVFKHWPVEEQERFITDDNSLRENYEGFLSVDIKDGQVLNAMEAYEKLKETFSMITDNAMMKEHVISDDLIAQAQFELAFNRNWVAYNTIPYFLEKGDMYFFRKKEEAKEFADNNISDYDDYKVIYAQSIADVLKQIPYGNNLEQQLSNAKNLSIMNEENLKYLKDNVYYMGFGDKQHGALEQHLREGKESFQLTYSAEVNKKKFEAVLNFRKSDKSDMYFFNSYHASLERKNGQKVEQLFYLTKGKGVTAKEAYNLLEGRAVFKELSNKAGEPFKAWIQLNFDVKDKNNNNDVTQYHENYGYDLKAAISKFAVADLNDAEKEKALLQSLQKGNIQSVFIEKEGSVSKMFIEANPQYKTVTLYDAQFKRVQKEALEQYKAVEQSQGKEVKQEQTQDMKQEKETTKKGKTQKDDSLLPKKRIRQKKGLGLS